MGNCFDSETEKAAERTSNKYVTQDNSTKSGTRRINEIPVPIASPQPRIGSLPPTPPFPDNNAKVVVAIYDYDARSDDDLVKFILI